MDRRKFLEATLGVMGGAFFASCSTLTMPQSKRKGASLLVIGRPNKNETIITLLNLDTGKEENFNVPVAVPHSALSNYLNPDEFMIFSIAGPGAICNRKTRSVKLANVPHDTKFNGHGTQVGDTVWCTSLQKKSVVLAPFSMQDLSQKNLGSELITAGHSVVRMPNSEVIACGNFLEKSGGGVTFLHGRTGQVLGRTLIPIQPVHLLALNENELVCVGHAPFTSKVGDRIFHNVVQHMDPMNGTSLSTDTPLSVWRVSKDGKSHAVIDSARPELARGGFFLTNIDGTNFVTTHRAYNLVVLWKGDEVLDTLTMVDPREVYVSSDKETLVVHGKEGVSFFSLKTRAFKKRLFENENVSFVSALQDYGA